VVSELQPVICEPEMSLTRDYDCFDTALSKSLYSAKIVDQAGLLRAQSLSRAEDMSLDRALLRLGLVDEDFLLLKLAEVLGLPHITGFPDYSVDSKRLTMLSVPYCQLRSVVPIQDTAGNRFLLTCDPANEALFSELMFYLEASVQVIVAPTRVIRSLLVPLDPDQEDTEISVERLQADQEVLRRGELDGPVIRFVGEAFSEAVAIGASDLHFEAQENGLRIRMRVNGILQDHPVDRSLSVASILARIKVMASMNVSERRLPQDGRIPEPIAGRKVDFRVSSVPTSFGESIVCRVLDPNALRLGWDRLGFDPETARKIVEIIEQQNGLFLGFCRKLFPHLSG